jgi:hypothetical protein
MNNNTMPERCFVNIDTLQVHRASCGCVQPQQPVTLQDFHLLSYSLGHVLKSRVFLDELAAEFLKRDMMEWERKRRERRVIHQSGHPTSSSSSTEGDRNLVPWQKKL